MNDLKPEMAVHQYFIQNKLTLSIAESCTGGSISARLTKLPGSSNYFLGSVVAYSNTLKVNLLHVLEKTLENQGAVSKGVVTEMAQGIIMLTKSHFSIAVSGIAGPSGGTPEKPVGTIWAAIGRQGLPPYVWHFFLQGNREIIIEEAVNVCLEQLLVIARNF